VSETPKVGEIMFLLFVDRISYSMAFLLHDSSNFGPSVGTGFLVGLGVYMYIASALHNFTFQGERPIGKNIGVDHRVPYAPGVCR
jgi:hypothetical protein